MILHSSEEIPETLCSTIQKALKKGLLEKSILSFRYVKMQN